MIDDRSPSKVGQTNRKSDLKPGSNLVEQDKSEVREIGKQPDNKNKFKEMLSEGKTAFKKGKEVSLFDLPSKEAATPSGSKKMTKSSPETDTDPNFKILVGSTDKSAGDKVVVDKVVVDKPIGDKTVVGKRVINTSDKIATKKTDKMVIKNDSDLPINDRPLETISADIAVKTTIDPVSNISSTAATAATASTAEIKPLADHISDKIVQISNSSSTESIITVKHPPMFEGIKVSIKESSGDVNLTFSNLNNQNKMVLDSLPNQNILRASMDIRGIPVHIIKTEGQSSTIGNNDMDQASSDKQQQEKGRGGGRHSKNRGNG
jgi:hypothetical protein